MNPADRLRQSISADRLELIERLGARAAERGLRLCLVGGAVRDILTGAGSPDLDLVLEGDALEFSKSAASELGLDLVRHPQFGTATLVTRDGLRADVATARRESYSRPGALPDVVPDTIETDLKRRDFTINAMAMSVTPPGFGELIDPFGGTADIQNRAIRALHDGSFTDDPTRILRGVRFAARFGYGFDNSTENLIRKSVGGGAFDTVSGARIKKEIMLLFDEPNRGAAVEICARLGIGNAIRPGFEFRAFLLAPEDRIMVSGRELGIDAEQWLAGLAAACVDNEPDALTDLAQRLQSTQREEEMFRQLASVRFKKYSMRLADAEVKPSEICELLEVLTPELLVVMHAALNEPGRAWIVRYLQSLKNIKLEITGDDLVAEGHEPGPHFGRALKETLDRKRDGLLAGRDAELEFAGRLIDTGGG